MNKLNGILDKIKGIIIKFVIIIGIPVVVIGGFVFAIGRSGLIASADSSDSYSDYTNLGDYVVKVDESGAMPTLTKEQLETAIKGGGFTDKMTQHYIEWIDAFMKVQDENKVNAAFAISVVQIEHGGGGPNGDINWGSIPSSTYNIVSIQDNSGTGGWMSYSSYEDAITNGFGNLIAEKYFSQNLYTVSAIANVYAPAEAADWTSSIKASLDKMYSAVGISLKSNPGSATGNAIVDKAAEIMQKMMNEGYAYINGNAVPMSANGKKGCDCSAFVCWVLYDLGITNCQNNGYQLTTYDMDSNGSGYFPNNGWQKITSYSDLAPGDIVIMSGEGNPNGHVQIFAYNENGQNYYINCGWAPSEHTSVYDTHQTDFYSAWRLPK